MLPRGRRACHTSPPTTYVYDESSGRIWPEPGSDPAAGRDMVRFTARERAGKPSGTWHVPAGSVIPPAIWALFRTGVLEVDGPAANTLRQPTLRRTRPKPGVPKPEGPQP